MAERSPPGTHPPIPGAHCVLRFSAWRPLEIFSNVVLAAPRCLRRQSGWPMGLDLCCALTPLPTLLSP